MIGCGTYVFGSTRGTLAQESMFEMCAVYILSMYIYERRIMI